MGQSSYISVFRVRLEEEKEKEGRGGNKRKGRDLETHFDVHNGGIALVMSGCTAV